MVLGPFSSYSKSLFMPSLSSFEKAPSCFSTKTSLKILREDTPSKEERGETSSPIHGLDSSGPIVKPLKVHVITLFPEMYPGPLGVSLVGKALNKGIWSLRLTDLRTHGLGAYGAVDEPAYGGGAGMVIRPDVVDAALREALVDLNNPRFVYMTPRGVPMNQGHFKTYGASGRDLVLLCGRYEGVDQRVLDHWNFEEISLGDFVLCGGDIPAMALIEGCVRLLPGVVHNPQSLERESFQESLLEHPLYTRPALWEGRSVPEVLLSGHHGRMEEWKKAESMAHTQDRRPEVWEKFIRESEGS